MQQRKLLIILAVLAPVLIAGWVVWQSLHFHIVSTDPSGSKIPLVTPSFIVNFNKPLVSTGLSVEGSARLVQNYHISGKSLVIGLNYPLEINKTYTIVIKSVMSEGGATITDRTLTVKAVDVPYDKLSRRAQQALLNAQDKNQGVLNDPLVAHLPHSTLDYNLSAVVQTGSKGKDVLAVKAELLLSNADVKSGEQQAIDQYKQEVFDYIRSFGLDPSKYVISFVVIKS